MYSRKRGSIAATVVVITLVVAVLILLSQLFDGLFKFEKHVAEVTVQPAAQTALRPFVVGPSTCLGTVSQRVQTKASRKNEIPIPIFPDIPTGTDKYYANVVLEADLCVDGIDGIGDLTPIRAVTTAEGINVVVNQQAGVFTVEPRVNAMLCSPEQAAAGEPCMHLDGGPSVWTKAVEELPWVDTGNDLTAQALAAAQVYAYSPECLQKGFGSVAGADFYDILLATFQYQAQQQGLAIDSVNLTLLDVEGKPTRHWDSTKQQNLFESQRSQLETVLPDGATLLYSTECDISGFGVTAPVGSSYDTSGSDPQTTYEIDPTGSTLPPEEVVEQFFPTIPSGGGSYVTVPEVSS